jgi:tRNA(fMet)-specific endonuclease VapC
VSALVVDTSSWIVYFAGRGSLAIDDALTEGRVYLPPIVAAEILSGRLGRKQREALEDLLGDLPLCVADLAHWCRVGRLRAALAARGVSVSTPDAHVAQCALDLRGTLLTEDAVFHLIAKHEPLVLATR